MVAHFYDFFSRNFKTLHFKISPNFKNRKLLPFLYLGLALMFGFAAHESSENSGLLKWRTNNPPTLPMWRGELSALGWSEVQLEKKQRELYRGFPFKNKAQNTVYYSQNLGCLAISQSPEREGLPRFFCIDSDLDSKIKPNWESLGIGWQAWDQTHLIKKSAQKPKILTSVHDPREIRY